MDLHRICNYTHRKLKLQLIEPVKLNRWKRKDELEERNRVRSDECLINVFLSKKKKCA